jgi:hypothetical protein
MKRFLIIVIICFLFAPVAWGKTLLYNQLDTVNLRDQGIPSDERSTEALIASGDVVYGVTSGDKCHVFRFDPQAKKVTVLADIPGPNTVLKGFVMDGDVLYAGTMLTKEQVWWLAGRNGGKYELEDTNLYPIEKSWNTGHLYRISGIGGASPKLEDLGVPVEGQGIHTMAIDAKRQLIYGLTTPTGRFFIYNIRTGKTETVTFGTTASEVSNHMVGTVEVVKDLTGFPPGDVEFNNKLIAKAMHVMPDGVLYTSGWNGQIIRYDPKIAKPQDRFKAVGWIPSVPGRQHWNSLDAIVEHDGKLYMGTSDGYIIRLDPSTNDIENLGKPISSIQVRGLAFSPLDGRLYGISGGEDQGISRFWCCDTAKGTFEVDYPAVKMFNLKPMDDIVATDRGTLVMAETERIANLWVLTPGTAKEWEKSGVIAEADPRVIGNYLQNLPAGDLFAKHKKLQVEVFPIPSALHGGSGYTAIQADDAGRIYVGGAYYGKFSPLMQLDPKTAQWKMIFRSDDLSHEYGRGQGIPGKIHTKLRLGKDGKMYGAMKQGYEFHFDIRSDMGESPYGIKNGQFPCHFFCYDPKTDRTEDLGPGYKQEGTVGFCADTDRGFLYGMTEPSGHFLVYNLKTGRIWNAGPWGGLASSRYMAMEFSTGRVYHKGEVTPSGKSFMIVWDPKEFKLRDYEIAAEGGLKYGHSYTLTSGATGTNKLYGHSDGKLWEMNMIPAADGKLHVRPLCSWSVDGETFGGYPYAIETGPDGRIYWACLYNNGVGPVPMSIFAWDPMTRVKSYLGTCALGSDYIRGSGVQGLCFDKKGNMAVHVLYCHLSPEQKKLWKVSRDFSYEDIPPQPYYLGYPGLIKDTYYSVYYVKGATGMK